MTYREALETLASFADFERAPADRVRYRDFNLQRVAALLELTGNPHQGMPIVHIAGTKGKGSTAATVASILTHAGLRTGLYTSPHLHTIRERIAIDGKPVDEDQLGALIHRLAPLARMVGSTAGMGQITTFELLTVASLTFFRDQRVGAAVLEVGLGGRLDATNVVRPVVCGITNISLDHVEVLGDTIAAIAGEKAAIIKPGTPVVVGPQPPEARDVIEAVASSRGAPATWIGKDVYVVGTQRSLEGQTVIVKTQRETYELSVPLLGRHQWDNVAMGVAIAERLAEQGLPVRKEDILAGVKHVSWPGRFEILQHEPIVVADGAHNPYSMAVLMSTAREYLPGRALTVILGVTQTKDLRGIVAALGSAPRIVIGTRSRHPKAVEPGLITDEARRQSLHAINASTTQEALGLAIAEAAGNTAIIVTGSLFVVAEARECILGIQPEPFDWTARAVV